MNRKNHSEDVDAAEAESMSGEPASQAEDLEPTTDDETLESVRAERDEYLDLWKRAQADYKNLRRSGQSDLEAGVRRAMLPLLENLLLVLDHLDIALSSPTPTEETRNFAVGVQMTRDQFAAALRQEELTEISTDGVFDPALHQAVAAVETEDAEPGAILETVRKGYTWRGSVLRHAQVRVAAGEAGREPGTDSADRSAAAEDEIGAAERD